jgi:hypothetical protein
VSYILHAGAIVDVEFRDDPGRHGFPPETARIKNRMNNFAAISLPLLALLFGNNALCCESLLGNWRSSKEMSMAYNNQHANLKPVQTELLNQILGHMKITYTKTEMREHASPPIRVKINNKEHDFTFEDLIYPYKVLSCDKNSARIKYKDPYAGTLEATINFVDQNTYWVSPEVMPSTREYFLRFP